MNKKDFSRNCLSEALIELLEENELSDISIQDIVDKAGFSRMAYYRNFKDKNELLDHYLDSVFEEFIKNTKLSFRNMGAERFHFEIFNFFGSEKVSNLIALLIKRRLVGHLHEQFIKRTYGGFLPNQNEYFYTYTAGGYFSVIIEWIKNGKKETPEQMAEQAINLANRISIKV